MMKAMFGWKNKKLLLIHLLALILIASLFLLTLKCKEPKPVPEAAKESPKPEQAKPETLPLNQKETAPEEFKTFLYKEYPLVLQYCSSSAVEAGLTSNDFQFNVWSGDVNDDGQKEYVVYPIQICGEDQRGASGNGPLDIWEKINDKWTQIAVMTGDGLKILKNKTNGYWDLQVFMHGSATSGSTTIYQNLGEKAGCFRYAPVRQEWYYY